MGQNLAVAMIAGGGTTAGLRGQNQTMTNGGVSASLNVSGTTIVKSSTTTLHKLTFPNGVASGGTAMVCDTNLSAGVVASNSIFAAPGPIAGGTVYALDWPIVNGIGVLVTSGAAAISYD